MRMQWLVSMQGTVGDCANEAETLVAKTDPLLRNAQYIEWREAYIDYGRIKKLIAEASNSSEGSRGMETLYPPADNLNDSELKIFHTLDAELEKVRPALNRA